METDKVSPLFVSEGNRDQKLTAIRRNMYLGTVYDSVLPLIGESLVIYGSSLQPNDEHILTSLIKGGLTRVAISIYRPGNPTWAEESASEKNHIQRIASDHNKSIEVIFFDAQSEGAWIY